MKTLAFRYDATQTYRCSEPGDQSGEYVKADVVLGLVEALREAREEIHYWHSDCLREVDRGNGWKRVTEKINDALKALEDVK